MSVKHLSHCIDRVCVVTAGRSMKTAAMKLGYMWSSLVLHIRTVGKHTLCSPDITEIECVQLALRPVTIDSVYEAHCR